jgi:hypothetical protein
MPSANLDLVCSIYAGLGARGLEFGSHRAARRARPRPTRPLSHGLWLGDGHSARTLSAKGPAPAPPEGEAPRPAPPARERVISRGAARRPKEQVRRASVNPGPAGTSTTEAGVATPGLAAGVARGD